MDKLYDADVFEWSQHQSALLRRRVSGELVNEAELDWPNIAEQIESVGLEQLNSVESLLVPYRAHTTGRYRRLIGLFTLVTPGLGPGVHVAEARAR